MRYDLTLRRNVPNYGLFAIAALLLSVPPLISLFRSMAFEAARWRESDYGTSNWGGNPA
jgi:hypothetical protein